MTFNLKDFPEEALGHWDIEAKHPDAFILNQIHLDRPTVYGSIQRIADSCANPPRNVNDIVAMLEDLGLVESVAALRSE